MEGVIFESGIIEERAAVAASIWSVIPRKLGKEAGDEEDKGKVMWANGEFNNYFEWMEYSINIHKK